MNVRRGVRARIVSLAAVGLISLLAGIAHAELTPDEVKAAFLYNFSKFVQWPAASFDDSKAPLVIGVLGSDGFGDLLTRFVTGKTVGGRGLVVRHGTSLERIGRCHLLFVSGTESPAIGESIDSSADESVLTVGEADDFISAGGMVQLGLVENRVRFAISRDRAERVGIRISSKVLNLSRIMVAQR